MSVLEAEAVGLLEALSWVPEITALPLVVEIDALLVVSAIRKKQRNHLEVGHVLEECSSILARRNNVSVVHVKKLANKVAHSMARIPCSLNSFIVFDSPPLSVLFSKKKKLIITVKFKTEKFT